MSLSACAELVQKGDPDKYLTAMTAPEDKQKHLLALYAFNLEIARAPWVTQEEMIAEMRLQWWQDALDDMREGKPARQHNVIVDLAETVDQCELPLDKLSAMVEARRTDIYKDPPKDLAAFDDYINRTSGHLMTLAAKTLGVDEQAMPHIADFAYGVGVANLLKALPDLYSRGHHPLPINNAIDAEGIFSDDAVPQLSQIIEQAKNRIKSARKHRREISNSALPALLNGYQADYILSEAAKDVKNVLHASLETSEFRKKANLLLRHMTGRW